MSKSTLSGPRRAAATFACALALLVLSRSGAPANAAARAPAEPAQVEPAGATATPEPAAVVPRAAEPSPEAERHARPEPQVLILHNSVPGTTQPGIVDGTNIIDLLGHFGLRGKLEAMVDHRKGDVGRYSFVIVLGDDERTVPFPAEVVTEVRAATVPVMWVKRHLHELLADTTFRNKVGFGLGPEVLRGYRLVNYKDKQLAKNEPTLFDVVIKNPARVQVIATAQNPEGDVRPYIVRSGNLWYVADSPFAFAGEGDRSWVFADVLHDFFGVDHPAKREALVRIEDVDIELDPKVLIDLADLLSKRDIPFQVGLIPIYKKPEVGLEVYLAERPEFVRAIRYMTQKGGTIIMHGSTHQYKGKTADDYEFWDGLNGKPIPGDAAAAVSARLKRGVEQLLRNGIYPLAWETPHYMASQLDYATFGKHFSCAYESVPSVDREDSAHQFPYPSVDRFGRRIIPESLGYIDKEKPEVEALIENSSRLSVVRDGVASFFFHPFLDRSILSHILDQIEAQGYEFTSVRDFGCSVRFDDIAIQTQEAPVELKLEDRYLHRVIVGPDGKVESEVYSQKPMNGKVADAGLVSAGSILVLEGVFAPARDDPAAELAWWQRLWQRPAVPEEPKKPYLPIVAEPKAVVLWDEGLPKADWNDQQSYLGVLGTFGFAAEKQALKDFPKGSLDRDTILVVTEAAGRNVSDRQLSAILDHARRGGRLVVEGQSKVASALGVKVEGKRPHTITRVSDLLLESEPMTWNPGADVLRYSTPKPLTVYAVDHEAGVPVAVLCPFGEGRFLYLAARFDPNTPLGYSRYPFLPHYLLQAFQLRIPLARSQLEVYFDPGLEQRRGVDPNRLASEWRKLGVRAIYAAAWHFWPAWSYDYATLIDACHKQGILVYAWLELPHVSQKFWDEHPECHAKTAGGTETYGSWRSMVDLDIPACQDLAFDFTEELLRSQNWDGANIAELNFDTNSGPEDQDKYIPMGTTTRQAFAALGGFDPQLLFNARSPYFWKNNPKALRKFEDYRADRVEAWHRTLLRRITPLAKERDMEIIVTMLDSLHSPTLKRDTGVDSHAIVALMDEFPFTLQVEDPAHYWAESPARYARFSDTYLRLVKDRRRLMFDLNVVPDRNISNSLAPTQRMVGIELAQSMVSASAASGRVAIYSEGTMLWEDMQMLSKVQAREAVVEGSGDKWLVQSPHPVLLSAPGDWRNYRVDDKPWPGWGEREVLLPSGEHRVAKAEKRSFQLVDTSALDFRMMHFTGKLETLASEPHGLQFVYDNYSRAMALFNREPSDIRIDGRHATEEPVHAMGQWALRLPRGHHTVDVVADSAATVILETTSLYSSSLIVIFGSVATGLMLLLYVAILARRALDRARRKLASPASRS